MATKQRGPREEVAGEDFIADLLADAKTPAVVLRRARTYEVEHEVASTLQRAMLPESLPEPLPPTLFGRH